MSSAVIPLRIQNCSTLSEWANARCAKNQSDGYIESGAQNAAYNIFDWIRNNGKTRGLSEEAFVEVVATLLKEALVTYAKYQKDEENEKEILACAGKRVHAIFLRFVASKNKLPPEKRTKMMEMWKKVWNKLEEGNKLFQKFNVVTFNSNEENECDPSELRKLDDNDTWSCVVS